MEVKEMTDKKEFLQMESEILRVIKSIYDPEIPVNIFDLGLIYEVDVKDDNSVIILMTLTSPNCPVADSLPNEVKEKTALIKGVKDVEVVLTFEPPWNKDMMSEEAQLELGFL